MSRSGWTAVWILSASLALALLVPARGETLDEALARHAKAIDARAATPPGQQRVADRVAAELNTACQCAAYSIEAVTPQRAQNGWGWGEVVIANTLAQALVPGIVQANPALTPAQAQVQATANVTTARQSMGWGAIAKANGLKVGDLVNSVEKTSTAVTATGKSRDATAGRQERQERGEGRQERQGPLRRRSRPRRQERQGRCVGQGRWRSWRER
jgi:hypothetical protein